MASVEEVGALAHSKIWPSKGFDSLGTNVSWKLPSAYVCSGLSIKVTVASLLFRPPTVSAPAFGPIPYLSMYKGGLLLDLRVCLLAGILCLWPLFPNALCHPLPQVW